MPYRPNKKKFMPLMCSHGHQWDSIVLGIDWNGALFDTPQCPTCGRTGARLQFTPADLGNMVNDDDIIEIGLDAMPTFASILMQICAEHEKSGQWETSFLLDELAEFICESRALVTGFLNQLRDKNFICWDAKYNQALRRVVTLGPRVRLVQLITE